ncbi:MAG: Gfo/Idh/MocA family oxidoreductase [Candidatus Bathyarchaeia archaeon]
MRAMQLKEHSIGVGIAGLGRFGGFLLHAYEEMEEVRISAVCDTNSELARALAPKGVQVYERFEDMLQDPAVEVVVIATPPYLHASMAIQAAYAGKHVVLEKPLATSLEEAEAAVKAARENKVLLTVDHVLRFHPLHQIALRVVRERVLGDLELFTLVNLATNEGLDPQHWFWDVTKSGGIHVEHGVHFFDLCNQLVGSTPTSVQGYAFVGTQGRVDRVAAIVRYGHKVFAKFYHSFNRPRCVERTTIHLGLTHGEMILEGWIPVRLILYGLVIPEKLRMLQQWLGTTPEILGFHGPFVQVQAEVTRPARQEEYKRALQALTRDFVQAILEKKVPLVTPKDALASLAVAVQAQASTVL